MTEEEYKETRRRILSNIDSFRKSLANAQRVFDRECDALRDLAEEWKAQQRD